MHGPNGDMCNVNAGAITRPGGIAAGLKSSYRMFRSAPLQYRDALPLRQWT